MGCCENGLLQVRQLGQEGTVKAFDYEKVLRTKRFDETVQEQAALQEVRRLTGKFTVEGCMARRYVGAPDLGGALSNSGSCQKALPEGVAEERQHLTTRRRTTWAPQRRTQQQ